MAKRSLWGSKTGFLLAAIGSAVGLGNIWRFGYVAYENGGGAFLVPYAVALVLAGIPLMILEYALGHREKASPPLAFARIDRRWETLGWWMPTVAFFGITSCWGRMVVCRTHYLGASHALPVERRQACPRARAGRRSSFSVERASRSFVQARRLRYFNATRPSAIHCNASG